MSFEIRVLVAFQKRLQTFSETCPLMLIHMYPATESEAKVVYKEPLFVIEDYFFKTVFIRGAPVENNTASYEYKAKCK